MTDAAELAVEAASIKREVGPGDKENGDVVAEVAFVEKR